MFFTNYTMKTLCVASGSCTLSAVYGIINETRKGRLWVLKKAYVEITNVCNLRCAFCPGTRRAPRTMSPAEFAAVLDRLRTPQIGRAHV